MTPLGDLDDDEPRRPAGTAFLQTQTPQLPERERGVDLILVVAVLALLCVGTVEIYSASAVRAGSATFLVKHLIYLAVGALFFIWSCRVIL
jgi:cell division protein FtsW (lipid II flippase)